MSGVFRSIKGHLSSIKHISIFHDLYTAIFSKVKQTIARNINSINFTFYILDNLWRILRIALAVFGTMLTYKALVQALSLYFEGYSGTMTLEFESQWLLLSAVIFLFVFGIGLVGVIIDGIYQLTKRRKPLLMPTQEYLATETFEQFRSEVQSEIQGINNRLGNMEHLLNSLLEDQRNKRSKESNEQT